MLRILIGLRGKLYLLTEEELFRADEDEEDDDLDDEPEWLREAKLKLSIRMMQQIRGSGAFRRFTGAIGVIGLEQAWYQFRASALERIAVEWLDEHQITYARETNSEEQVK